MTNLPIFVWRSAILLPHEPICTNKSSARRKHDRIGSATELDRSPRAAANGAGRCLIERWERTDCGTV